MRTIRSVAGALLAFAGAAQVQAQDTDAVHAIQVFPVVVDSASFAQRFHFRNPNAAALTVSVLYFPANGTTQAGTLACPAVNVPAGGDVSFASLRALCPALAAGSQFGFLYTWQDGAANLPYAAFSRVANPQGNGFSVEAFPAQAFTSADAAVSGVRRLSAGPSNPAFQTNCFVGVLNDVTPPGVAPTTTVVVRVYNAAGAKVGSDLGVALTPGKLVRLLDVFAAVGAPAGDYNDARVEFEETGDGEPGVLALCTVQDNTSFGADFRIAKQERSFGGDWSFGAVGAQDDGAARDATLALDVATNTGPSSATQREFRIAAGASANTHVFYFRHPDWIQCEAINPGTGLRALAAYGLEMRLLAEDGVTVLAGGNESQGWGKVYLGDKDDRNAGANTRYTLEVESNEQNAGNSRPYELHCQSGSGHTGGELVRYQEAANRF